MRSTRHILQILAAAGFFLLAMVGQALAQDAANPTLSKDTARKDAVLRGDAKCTRCHDENDDYPVFAIGKTRHGTVADGLLAGRRLRRHQAAVEQHRGAVEGVLDLALQAHVAPLRPEVAAHQVGQLGGEYLTQPADEFTLAGAQEAGEVAVRLQEGLLDQVRRIDLALEALADLHAGQ